MRTHGCTSVVNIDYSSTQLALSEASIMDEFSFVRSPEGRKFVNKDNYYPRMQSPPSEGIDVTNDDLLVQSPPPPTTQGSSVDENNSPVSQASSVTVHLIRSND